MERFLEMAVLTNYIYSEAHFRTSSNIIPFPFWNQRSWDTLNGGQPKPIGIWLSYEFVDMQFNRGIPELEYCNISCKLMTGCCGSPA